MARLYTLKEIASAYDHPITTTRDHIIKLKLEGTFKKSSREVSYTAEEVAKLEKLLNFKIKK